MEGLGRFLNFLFVVIALLVVLAVFGNIKACSPCVIESDTQIIPEKRLRIKNNAVDTVFIYRKPKQ